MVFKEKRSSRRIWQRSLGNSPRQLRFDVLEDRRVLAGLDVFVFNDIDGSRDYLEGAESGITRQIVFVDLNRNSQHDLAEPIAISNDQGIATFENLPDGDYAIQLLGGNRSLHQTTNTTPSLAGEFSPSQGMMRVLKWSGENSFWGVAGSDLVKVELASGRQLDRVRLGTGTIVDLSLISGSENSGSEIDSPLSGYAILGQETNAKQLVRFASQGNQAGLVETISIDANSLGSLVLVQNELFGTDSAMGDVRWLVSNNLVVDQPLNIGPTDSDSIQSTILPLGTDRFVVLDSIEGGERLSIYRLPAGLVDGDDYSVKLIAERSFPTINHWTTSPEGNWILVDTGSESIVIDVISGLPTLAALSGSQGPFFLDSTRGLVYSGSTDSATSVAIWNELDWTVHSSMELEWEFTPQSSLVFSSSGRQTATVVNDQIYTRNLSVARPTIAKWEHGSTQTISIGLQYLGTNSAPTVTAGAGWQLAEDSVASVQMTENSGGVGSDREGDKLHWIVLQGPQRGALEWSSTGVGNFVPNQDAYGRDTVFLAAFDGRDWSNPVSVPIAIQPSNDSPSGIELGNSTIPENSSLQTELTTVRVLDPDMEDIYDITVDDTRFSVIDNILQLVRGNLNFEREAFVPIVVSAINRLFPSDRTSRTLTLTVSDQNDPPTGVSVQNNLTVPELTEDVVLGDIDVIDEDHLSDYVWTVSDGRFEIKDGKLRLSDNTQLDFETQSTIALHLRAVDRSTSWAIEKSVQISVTDQDDAPIGLVLSGSGQVPERRQGVAVGNASVIDPDRGEAYRISVSDPRFEVVSGVVKLKTGQSVDWIEPGYLDLVFTATSLRSGTQISKSGRLNIIKDKTPYHNDSNPADVDGDGTVSPLDPLILINYINKYGPGVVQPEGEGPTPDLDVDGDGVVSPIDVLIVVNRINNKAIDSGSGGGTGGNGGGSKPEGEAPDASSDDGTVPQSSSPELQKSLAADQIVADWTSDPLVPTGGIELGPRLASDTPQRDTNSVDYSLASYLEEMELESLRSRRRFPR